MGVSQRSFTLVVVLSLLVILAQAQNDIQTQASDDGLGSRVEKLVEEVKGAIKENKEVARDVLEAHKEILGDKQQIAVQAIDLITATVTAGQSLISQYFPYAELPFIQNILSSLEEYKNQAALVFGLLATAFQMMFGGGFRYLTSKIKNLSDHKLKIQSGFDLQHEITRRDQDKREVQYDYKMSSSFQSLFSFLDINDNREVKLVLGCNGLGIPVAVKQWVKNLKKVSQDPIKEIYYDLKAPLIKSKSNQDANHLENLSSLIYSLLYKEHRSLVLAIVKGFYQKIQNGLNGLIGMAESRPIMIPVMVLLFVFIRTLFYLIIAYCLFYGFGSLLSQVYRQLQSLVSLVKKKINGLYKNDNGCEKLKIIIGNIHILQAQSHSNYESIKGDPSQPITFLQHQQLFYNNLTTLINNMSALQFKSLGQIQIILIVANSQFYYNCLQKLRLTEGNAFKVKRIAQLPFADSKFITNQRTIDDKAICFEKKAYEMTDKLALFHNNSKEIVKLLKEINLERQTFDPQLLPGGLKQIDIQASVIRTSMSQIITYAGILKELIETKNPKGPESPKTYDQFTGLFLGCLHKKILFFVNRREHSNPQFQQLYNSYINCLNNDSNIDMLSTISPSNKRYLFQRTNNLIQLKKDPKLIVLKWDALVAYIQGDNNWQESLRDEFVLNYLQSCKQPENIAENSSLKVAQFSSDNPNLVTQARLFFDQITTDLTNKEILFQHTFSSKSMALANYYLQEKIKEEKLYHHFLSEINQHSTLMAQLEKQYKGEIEKQGQAYDELLRQFDRHVLYRSFTYQGGTSWLKHYNSCQVGSNSKFPQKRKKYLLDSTQNSYILKPFVNNLFLYWRRFNTQLSAKTDSGKMGQLFKDKESWQVKVKLMLHWENKKMKEEEQVSKGLLGCGFQEIAGVVQQMEEIENRARDMKYIHTRIYDGFREAVRKNVEAYLKLAFPNQEAIPANSLLPNLKNHDPERLLFLSQKQGDPLKLSFHQLQLLLNEYQPDGLFQQLNSNYRSVVYQCKAEAQYQLSKQFKQLVLIYNVCKHQFSQLFSSKDDITRCSDTILQKLSKQDRPLCQRFSELDNPERMVLFNMSQDIKKRLSDKLPKDQQQICSFLIFDDLKTLISAFCFSHSPKIHQ